jgi:hypothetical protein
LPETGILTRIGAVLGKAAVHGDTMGLEMLTEQLLAASAVKALSAKLRVIGNHSISNCETLDFGPHSCHHTNSFVTCEIKSTMSKSYITL